MANIPCPDLLSLAKECINRQETALESGAVNPMASANQHVFAVASASDTDLSSSDDEGDDAADDNKENGAPSIEDEEEKLSDDGNFNALIEWTIVNERNCRRQQEVRHAQH